MSKNYGDPDSIFAVCRSLSESFSDLGEWFARNQLRLYNAIIMALISVVAAILVHKLTKRWLPALFRRKVSALAGFFATMATPAALGVLMIGLSVSNNLVDYPGKLDMIFDRVFYALFLVVTLAALLHIIDFIDIFIISRFERRRPDLFQMNKLMLDLGLRIIKAAIWVATLVFILQKLFDLAITPILTGAGVLGVAIAFASQNTIANLFGAFSILGSRLFKVGDWVRSGDIEGIVEKIGFRSVKIRAFDGKQVDVPNRMIADAQLENFSDRRYWREEFNYGLIYQTPPEKIRQALEIIHQIADELGSHLEGRRADFFFNKCGASSLEIRGFVWFEATDWYTLQHRKEKFNLTVVERFNAAGLSFAYPTQTIFIAK